MLAQHRLPVAGLGGTQDQIRLSHPDRVQLGCPQGADDEDRGGDRPDQAWPATNLSCEPEPHALRRHAALCRNHVGFEPWSAWPECRATEGEEHRGEQGERREHGEDDPDRGHRSEAAVRLEVAQQQAQESRDDRAARGDDRLERGADGSAAGNPRIAVDPQLLPVPRHVEQRVVGRRTDHQDEQDPLRLAAQRQDLRLGQPPHAEEGNAERKEAGCQDSHRQQDGPIDRDEDDEDGEERHAQEEAVDPGKGSDQVRRESGRAGDVDGDASRRGGTQGVADLLHHVADRRIGSDRDECLHRLSVLGRDGRGDLFLDTGDPGKCCQRAGNGAQLLLGQDAIAREDDDCRDRLRLAEGSKEPLYPRGVG